MRKFYSFLIAAIALVGVAAPASAQDGPKLGFIDSQRIVAEDPGYKSAQQAFERDMQRFRGELDRLRDEIEKMITDYEQQQQVLSPEARKQREEAIRQKQREAQSRAQQLEEQAAKRQGELIQPVMTRINEIIDQIRADGNYAMIFDAASGAMVAADPALDLTDQVLARLKATAKK